MVCNLKAESRIELPATALLAGLLALTLLFSELLVDTELLRAANTTLANGIPDVDPNHRGSEAPSMDTY